MNDLYSKIREGLNKTYSEREAQKNVQRAEVQFNRSQEAFEQALVSKDGEFIEKIVNELVNKRKELSDKIFMSGGKNRDDIEAYKSVTSQLEQLEIHVNALHDKGVI